MIDRHEWIGVFGEKREVRIGNLDLNADGRAVELEMLRLASENAALRERMAELEERIGDTNRWPQGTSASSYMNYLREEYEALKSDFDKANERIEKLERVMGAAEKYRLLSLPNPDFAGYDSGRNLAAALAAYKEGK